MFYFLINLVFLYHVSYAAYADAATKRREPENCTRPAPHLEYG